MAKKVKKSLSLSKKAAGLTASAAISFAVLISVANRQDPYQTLSLSAMAGFGAGFIGYLIGAILEKPPAQDSKKDNAAASKKQKTGSAKRTPEVSDDYTPIAPVTGDESFLDDLTPSTAEQEN